MADFNFDQPFRINAAFRKPLIFDEFLLSNYLKNFSLIYGANYFLLTKHEFFSPYETWPT